jgi:hypothetical protein
MDSSSKTVAIIIPPYLHFLLEKLMIYVSNTFQKIKLMAPTKSQTQYSKTCPPDFIICSFSSSLTIISNKPYHLSGNIVIQYYYIKKAILLNSLTNAQLHWPTLYTNFSLVLLPHSSYHTEKNTKSYTIVKKASDKKDAQADKYKH